MLDKRIGLNYNPIQIEKMTEKRNSTDREAMQREYVVFWLPEGAEYG